MRNVKFLCLFLTLITSTAFAGPKEDAFQVVERWARAFTEADVDTIVNLYASDAVFMGTGSKMIVTKPEDIKKYFQTALDWNRKVRACPNKSMENPESVGPRKPEIEKPIER